MVYKRLIFIDLLRFLAIYLMFWDHSLKLFYSPKGETGFPLVQLILGITSLSSALFLFLVGFSLVLSFNRFWPTKRSDLAEAKPKENISDWVWTKAKRGLTLVGISYLLFIYTSPLGLVNLPLTSGVLQLIGITLIFLTLTYYLKKPTRLFLVIGLNLLIIAANYFLRLKGVEIAFLNQGNFPLLPHLSYSLTGLTTAELFIIFSEKRFSLWSVGVVSLVLILFFLSLANFNPFIIFESRYLTGNYWQPSGLLLVFNSLIIILLAALLALSEEKIKSLKLVRKIGQIGQEALNIYIWHILLLWGVGYYLLPYLKLNFSAIIIITTGLVGLSLGWVKFRKVAGNY